MEQLPTWLQGVIGTILVAVVLGIGGASFLRPRVLAVIERPVRWCCWVVVAAVGIYWAGWWYGMQILLSATSGVERERLEDVREAAFNPLLIAYVALGLALFVTVANAVGEYVRIEPGGAWLAGWGAHACSGVGVAVRRILAPLLFVCQ